VVLFCEPGGAIEENVADMLRERCINVPIVAFIAGRFVDDMPGVRFGHAATIVEGDRGSARSKQKAFENAGIRVAGTFSDIVTHLRQVL
jgi:succinyl-CoA synthetase alpha subunit